MTVQIISETPQRAAIEIDKSLYAGNPVTIHTLAELARGRSREAMRAIVIRALEAGRVKILA